MKSNTCKICSAEVCPTCKKCSCPACYSNKTDRENLYDDPTNFEYSEDVRNDGLKLCSAPNDDQALLDKLKSCPNFAEEDEADPKQSIFCYCRYCWADGKYSVCEARPIGSEEWIN